MLAAIEHPNSGSADAAAVFCHLLSCRGCRAALAFVCTAVALEQDRERQQLSWRQFQAMASNALSPAECAADGECIDAIAAEMPACLIFESEARRSGGLFWRATMTFPDIDQPDAPLTIRVNDAKGNPIQSGEFLLFGVKIPLVDGTGIMTRAQLAACHHKGGAAFRRQGGRLTYGAPVLNA